MYVAFIIKGQKVCINWNPNFCPETCGNKSEPFSSGVVGQPDALGHPLDSKTASTSQIPFY